MLTTSSKAPVKAKLSLMLTLRPSRSILRSCTYFSRHKAFNDHTPLSAESGECKAEYLVVPVAVANPLIQRT